MLTLLPQDLARLIIELLTHAEGLCALEATCKALRLLVDDSVWHNAFRHFRHFRLLACRHPLKARRGPSPRERRTPNIALYETCQVSVGD